MNYKTNVFRFVSQWQGLSNPYYLTTADLTSNPRLVISTANDSSTYFTMDYHLMNGYHGFRLLTYTGSRVVDCGTASGDLVTLGSDTLLNGYTVLCWGNDDNGYAALRPVSDTNLNLNVQGGGTYTNGQSVIMYPWQGGKQNMRWKAEEVSYSELHTIRLAT